MCAEHSPELHKLKSNVEAVTRSIYKVGAGGHRDLVESGFVVAVFVGDAVPNAEVVKFAPKSHRQFSSLGWGGGV